MSQDTTAAIDRALEERGTRKGARFMYEERHSMRSIHHAGSTQFNLPGLGSKQGDAGFGPADGGPHGSDWPSLMTEMGYSESIREPRLDAEWWLWYSRGKPGWLFRSSLINNLATYCDSNAGRLYRSPGAELQETAS
ncbi:hypothetical protein C7212DRAFT_345419 [Tuber magnatum]|uniref:Uncharacterized protein n=1 Tax=Tuber magnatum TaxID=42249 RepID=A0A317SPR1_9PEZI|nr:hypothetical protein C7212DRAFT_345419 [Tuber magnatum]